MKYERYVTSDIKNLINIRIKRLENKTLCINLLKEKFVNSDISQEVIENKAVGLSAAIRSSLGFWNQKPHSLNSWILSRYYGLLEMTIAEQVASDKNIKGLSEIQKATSLGHGLKIYWNDKSPLDQFVVYIKNTGYFKTYLEHLKIDLSACELQENIKKEEDFERNKEKVVSIIDLLRRIPELSYFVKEYLHQESLAFHIGYDSLLTNETYPSHRFSKESDKEKKCVLGIYNTNFSIEELKKFLPFLKISMSPNSESENQYPIGEFTYSTKYWFNSISLYKSAYCGSSYIFPCFKYLNDVVAINLMLMYGLSIIVRYYPNLWHKIEFGDYSEFSYLLEHYLTIVDNTLPLLLLERISGHRIDIVLPGTWNAPL